MGRHRGAKFLSPILGRKSSSKFDKVDTSDSLSPVPSNSSHPSVSEWSARYEEPADSPYPISKAQRVLGTAGPLFRAPSKPPSVPSSPRYMPIAATEPCSEFDDRQSSRAGGNVALAPPQRPNLSNRASSNILPTDMAFSERRGSNCSSVSRHLNGHPSNSTLRSHYDAQSSPLAISQQTSDSAVRDMALRKGKPQIGIYAPDQHTPSPLAHEYADEQGRESRRTKPARLDLSKLFPKPKGDLKRGQGVPMLSPTKMVNSPTAMSVTSDIFPRPMTREPTPERGHAKLTKSKRQQASIIQPPRSRSPVRIYKRDEYDSAKINVRRPPRGIQHWFEGYDDDSDELDATEHASAYNIQSRYNTNPQPEPIRKSSLKPQPLPALAYAPDGRRRHHLYSNPGVSQSQSSLATTRTKESSMSRANLQNSSVLSFSSSEDEGEDEEEVSLSRKASTHSVDMNELHGDIIIGQAQAMDVRPQHTRRTSAGKLSLMSTSTNTATIEMIYTPEPYAPHRFPRPMSSSRRSSHVRQPSIIPEDEDVRPRTAVDRPMSPSGTSFRTSRSEPRARQGSETSQLMAVTPEEMALLEALRKKRADMGQQSSTDGYSTAVKQEDRQLLPPTTHVDPYRTSGFLAAETPAASPIRLVDTKKKAHRRAIAPVPPPLLVPTRGRSGKLQDLSNNTSILRDSSSCGPRSSRQLSPVTLAHVLSPPPEFSPLDPFPPSPTQSASIASLTTTNHPSPIPSPVTPGPRHGEGDVLVKVASSEPSCDGDEDVTVPETGIIDPPTGSIKPNGSQHQRRRTASSGADIPITLVSKPSKRELLGSVSEASSRSRTPSVDAMKNHHRQNTLPVTTTGLHKSRQSSVASLRTPSPNSFTERKRHPNRVSSINSKRESVIIGSASTRCSVSEDVLAAWGSLGGLREYERTKF